MVANRIDGNKESADKAEKPQPSAPTGSSGGGGGGLKAWLPLLITILTMPLLAYGMTTFVLLPKLQHGLGRTARAPHEGAKEGKNGKDAEAKKENAALTKLLVNVAGSMGSRYLLVSLTLVGTGADFRAKIERNDPQLRDAAGGVLSAKSLADLEKPGARNLVRSELISAFNNVLGATTVQEIYLTEFAVQ
jgi:flagellar protein FliL